MDRKLLHEIGILLYGPNYRCQMARNLGVSDRTVRRWLNDEHSVSPQTVKLLLDFVELRLAGTEKALAALRKTIQDHPG